VDITKIIENVRSKVFVLCFTLLFMRRLTVFGNLNLALFYIRLERCSLDCGEHGECEGGSCSCAPGWSGARCTVRECDPRCSAHGSCSNGTCLCTNGWNGKHCTLEGNININSLFEYFDPDPDFY